jgi:hypothetical protein
MNSAAVVIQDAGVESTSESTNDRLAVAVTGLEPTSASTLRAVFEPLFAQAEEWSARAKLIKVTSVDQTREMKLARESRLGLRQVRVAADKERKRLKADSLRLGRAIDGAYSVFEAVVAPIEEYLRDQETFAERAEESRKTALASSRAETLVAYGASPDLYAALGDMSDEAWVQTVESAKLAHEARIEAARQAEAVRVEAERIMAEKREAERKERIAAEAERVDRERVQAEENAKLRRELAAREDAARVEREAAEKARAYAARIEREEREAIEAKAKAEREAAAEETRKARAEVDRLEAERLALATAERERAAAEVARLEAERAEFVAAQAAAELAPDREKLAAFAVTLRALQIPVLTTTRGKAAAKKVADQIDKMAAWVAKTSEAM